MQLASHSLTWGEYRGGEGGEAIDHRERIKGLFVSKYGSVMLNGGGIKAKKKRLLTTTQNDF